MKKFHIKHVTRFSYSRPVFCEPMMMRLRPREDGSQRLLSYSLSIDPRPAGSCEFLDLDGHVTTRVWFDKPAGALSVTTYSEVQTLQENPFNFLLQAGTSSLPVAYPEYMRPQLAAYQRRSAGSAVTAVAEQLIGEAEHKTVPFLVAATRYVHETIEIVVRPTGDPVPADTTLDTRRGSCRDLAVLFNELARAAGLACRFVSGYCHCGPEQLEHQLHAWSEVFLPGAGWRGFDPTHGLATADQHVALAAAANPAAAAPTTGTFRGTGVTSSIDTQLVLRTES